VKRGHIAFMFELTKTSGKTRTAMFIYQTEGVKGMFKKYI